MLEQPFNFLKKHRYLLLFIVLMLLFVFRLVQLQLFANESDAARERRVQESVCTKAQWKADEASCIEKKKDESHKLFESLLAYPGLVEVKDDGQVVLPPRDYVLALMLNNTAEKEPDHDLKNIIEPLMEQLFFSAAGATVRHQVSLWNQTRRFTALRDNFNPQKSGENKSIDWSIYDEMDTTVPTAQIAVPLHYGYVNHGKLGVNFNDWLAVSRSNKPTYKATIKVATTHKLRLDVIGQPDTTYLRGSGLKLESLEACFAGERGSRGYCKKVSQAQSNSKVHRINLRLSPGTHQLRIPIRSVSGEMKKVDGLAIQLIDDQKVELAARLLWNPVSNSGARVSSSNQNGVSISSTTQINFKISMANGEVLFDANKNKLEPAARKYLLQGLIGEKTDNRFTLAGLVARSASVESDTHVVLSFQSVLQRSLIDQIKGTVKQVAPNGEFKSDRRVGAVLMDPLSGEILAAVNNPTPPEGVHDWDRLSYSQAYPDKDPYAMSTWQSLDKHSAPGSSFKLVSSLSALQAAYDGNRDVERMLDGVSPRSFKSVTGLTLDNTSFDADGVDEPGSPTTTIKNAGGASFYAALPHKDRSGKKTIKPMLRISGGQGCPSRPVYSKTIGLKEAIRDSYNTWFAKQAVMVDEWNLSGGGKDTQLVNTAKQLGFGQKFPLAPVGSPLNPDGRLTEHGGRGSVLTAYAGNLSLETLSVRKPGQGSAESDALQRLVQNSIGQGVTTTPLQMARVSSAIATGNLPTPYLLKSWGGDMIKPAKPERLDLKGLSLLREGMKAVTEDGTAASAFKRYYPDGRCMVYGKTGTSQVASSNKTGRGAARANFNTAWFTGWEEDESGNPAIAFACMVTHTRKGDNQLYSGGDVCGGIIAKVLHARQRALAGE